MPWQFSVRRTANEIIIEQARGPAEKFDPVVKRFSIKKRSLNGYSTNFHYSVIRRVWSEDPDRPQVRSQRSVGHVIEFLYSDQAGWHIARLEAQAGCSTGADEAHYEPTSHPGISVSSTFLRAKTDSGLRYTEMNDYRVNADVLDEYADIYVLSYYEENEESIERLRWNIDDVVASQLIQ